MKTKSPNKNRKNFLILSILYLIVLAFLSYCKLQEQVITKEYIDGILITFYAIPPLVFVSYVFIPTNNKHPSFLSQNAKDVIKVIIISILSFIIIGAGSCFFFFIQTMQAF